MSFINSTDWSSPDEYVASDACLSGCGGVCGSEGFHSEVPDFILRQSLHISALELLSIVVCLKLWCNCLSNRRIVLVCDNLASVILINTGRSRDVFLQSCLRELVLLLLVMNLKFELCILRDLLIGYLMCCQDGI